MNENLIRFGLGPLLIIAIYGLTTFLMGLPFEWTPVIVVIAGYAAYSYFRYVRK